MSNTAAVLSTVNAHIDAGRFDQAKALLKRHLQRSPRDSAATNAYAIALFKSGEYEQALFYAQRAAAGEPTNPVFLETLGTIFGQLQRANEAADAFRRACAIAPGDAALRLGLSHALWDAGDLEAAIRTVAEAIAIAPDAPHVHTVYASALQNVGDIAGCERFCRQALSRWPMDPPLIETLILALNYSPRATPAEIVATAREYHRALLSTLPKPGPGHGYFNNDTSPDRPLRVGYLSPDLRRHSVAYFIEPALEHHDPAQVQTFCYYTASNSDAFTARMRKLRLTWRDCPRMTDDELAAQIKQDKIDVLVELSGHTIGNRLGVMARLPAPVGVSYLGYPNTTGFSGLFRIVDEATDPPGSDADSSERLWRLPGCYFCYKPDPDAPEPAPPPSAANGFITFGSFNNLAKLSEDAIALWARIVNNVPGSKLVLKFAQSRSEWLSNVYRQRFVAAGLAADRLEILGKVPEKAGHLAAYGRMDIALDPFPHSGATTTCEALWMGVPVVGLRGNTHPGRLTTTILRAVGLESWSVETEDQYAAAAVALANDRAGLAELRRTLRPRMLASPLCDGPGFARRLEDAYRGMWKMALPKG